MKRRHFIATIGAGLGSFILPFPSFAASENTFPFQDGDTACFIGDSITHNGAWLLFASTFFMTRFPEKKIRYINNGISGDTTYSVLNRWKTDILPNKPNVGIVMLGMNDVGRSLYTSGKPSAQNLQQRKASLQNYQRNMKEIVHRLKEMSCRQIVLVSPSPFDQTAKINRLNNPGINDALAEFSSKIQELAQQEQALYVDIHGPMTQLQNQQQLLDPSFSFTPYDRIHPSNLGHQIIAYYFLKGLQVPDTVSEISILSDTKTVAKETNACISNLVCSSSEITFDLLENALPYPIPPDLEQVSKMVPLNADLNKQIFQVQTILNGKWSLKIDDKEIGQYSSEELQRGINLAENNQTPQYQQALEVFHINRERINKERQCRDFVKTNMQLRQKGISLNDDTQIKRFFTEHPTKGGASYSPSHNELFSNYFEIKNQLPNTKTDINHFFQQIEQKSKPVSHRYSLSII